MSELAPSDKLAQFDEFFSIKHKFNVNIAPLSAEQALDYQSFIDSIPLPFKMASDVGTIDQAALRPLQGLASSASQLVEYLQHQANKINMLVGYILSQQDEPAHRYQGVQFGGGGIVFSVNTTQDFALGDKLTLKIFLLEDNCAIYCYGEIVELKTVNIKTAQQATHYKVIFQQIREQDRELLVRTSLHQQSKQLQALSQQRNQAAQQDS